MELNTRVTGCSRNFEPAGTLCRQTGATATTDTEVQVHVQQDRMSTYTGHYEEIVDSESSPELPTSGDDEEESASEYAGLDPVAVAESRARPPPVYEGLGRRGVAVIESN